MRWNECVALVCDLRAACVSLAEFSLRFAELMLDMTVRLEEMLTASANRHKLSFVVFVPGWTEAPFWSLIHVRVMSCDMT
jgi:hypothetical protein